MEIQEKVREFVEENNLECSPEHRALDLVSEIGEVAKEILKTTDYGTKEREYRKELEDEMGDVLFSLIALANTFNIDLEKALNKALDKYQKRMAEKGNAGS
ncbi:MAG: MazG-like family protein [Nanoarchaeota archaeon]|nr:MazG-like family protein [Nanoarchaeota archaeon]